MKTIDEMIDDVIRREGGYVNHPADRGGPTNMGITLATFRREFGSDATIDELRTMPVDVAKQIYTRHYYYAPGIDKLPPSIQPFMLDAMVNHRPKDAIRLVQRVLLDAGYDPGPIDGIVGPRTIAAANRYDRKFLDELISKRRRLYHSIVARDPNQEVFLAGWMHRLDEFLA